MAKKKHIFERYFYRPDLRELELRDFHDMRLICTSGKGREFALYLVMFIQYFELLPQAWMLLSPSGKRNFVFAGGVRTSNIMQFKLLLDELYAFYGPDIDGGAGYDVEFLKLAIRADWEGPVWKLEDHAVKVKFVFNERLAKLQVTSKPGELDGIERF